MEGRGERGTLRWESALIWRDVGVWGPRFGDELESWKIERKGGVGKLGFVLILCRWIIDELAVKSLPLLTLS